MGNKILAQAEANRELIRRVDDALRRGDMATVNSLFDEQCVLQIADGHPAGGTFKGIDNVNKARARMKAVLRISHVETQAIVADGSPLVMSVVQASGTDAAGKPWSMPVAEVIKIVDGKISELRLFFLDTARLQEIAGGRQAQVDSA
jgi:ketosteroid isomerase-like protein